MREFIKVMSSLLIMAGFLGGILMFSVPGIDSWRWRWPVFGLSLVLAGGGLVLFLKIHYQRDKAPDFLSAYTKKYFDRDGFCFFLRAVEKEGDCVLQVLYQNRYSEPSRARIAIRPARELFMRSKIEAVGIDIECEPAAFGVAEVAMPVPEKYQGKAQRFEVGASVTYPNGKGEMLRYRDGIVIRGDATFNNAFGAALSAAALAGGSIVLSSPASVNFTLPAGVSSDLNDRHMVARLETLWRLGDEHNSQSGESNHTAVV